MVDTKEPNDHKAVVSLIESHPSRLEIIVHKAEEITHKTREKWGKSIEFLLTCISMCVGLGNLWRFPFTALENGGGAFLVPYITVLFLIGKPVYFMEMLLGQFSSRGSVKVYDMAPIMRGVGYGQAMAMGIVSTYYASIMALTLKYFYESFNAVLPWTVCDPNWKVDCIPSGADKNSPLYSNTSRSSSELYFVKTVQKEIEDISEGIGLPDVSLTICLALSWATVLLTIIKGIKSTGKASYVLALFPYVSLIILLIRACTLPGAWEGIKYFLNPQWAKILEPKVWFEAVMQVFFSLAICFGCIIMYSSYNDFSQNIHRDVTIITSIDLFTSMLAGCTIFGILGHLAHQEGITDIRKVVRGGPGLAFISYPEAIANFEAFPQLFSALFFIMLFILGIGSNVSMTASIATVIRDQFPKVKNWQVASVLCCLGFLSGIAYLTPGGQLIFKLVDYFGVSMIAFALAILELVTFCWIYGADQLCKDAEFMLGFRPNLYWRICWKYISPTLMILIFLYSLAYHEPLKYQGKDYPSIAVAFGSCLSIIGLIQLPIWGFYAIFIQDKDTMREKILNAFKPNRGWGPANPKINAEYREFLDVYCRIEYDI